MDIQINLNLDNKECYFNVKNSNNTLLTYYSKESPHSTINSRIVTTFSKKTKYVTYTFSKNKQLKRTLYYTKFLYRKKANIRTYRSINYKTKIYKFKKTNSYLIQAFKKQFKTSKATISNNYKDKSYRILVRPTTKVGFLLRNVNIFVKSNYLYFRNILRYNFLYKSNMKKSLYTFLKPNQIKNTYLRRKSTIQYINLTQNVNKIFQSKIHQIQNLFFMKNILKKTLKLSNNYYINQFFNKIDNKSLKNYNLYKETDEVKLKRVKFKPGYQRI
jgi:hypothetical protein